MGYDAFLKNLPPLIGLVVLVLVLFFVLVQFGYLRACDIPGFSGIYYSVKGAPAVALVMGDDGTGDPDYLRRLIVEETKIFPREIPLSIVDSSVLKNYQIIIVEHAKTIPTKALLAFRDYVYGGGKLVWMGDAGTGLGDNDYVCEKVTFGYRLAYDTQVSEEQTQEICLDWYYETPNSLDNSDDGLCGMSFGEIVLAFIEQNQTIYESTSTGLYHLCAAEKNAFTYSNAERILNCINALNKKGLDVTVPNVNENCDYNSWKRGPSKTAIGDTVSSVDFSTVLGVDFVKNMGPENMFLIPSEHELVGGYETSTRYYGTSDVTLVDSSRFASISRTSTVMSIRLDDPACTNGVCPAILISNPYPTVPGRGLVVFYAFPLDDLIKEGEGGLRLINNLFRFLTC